MYSNQSIMPDPHAEPHGCSRANRLCHTMLADDPKKAMPDTRSGIVEAADWFGSELVADAHHARPQRIREACPISSRSVGADERAIGAGDRRAAKIGVANLGACHPVAGEHVLEAEAGGPAHP